MAKITVLNPLVFGSIVVILCSFPLPSIGEAVQGSAIDNMSLEPYTDMLDAERRRQAELQEKQKVREAERDRQVKIEQERQTRERERLRQTELDRQRREKSLLIEREKLAFCLNIARQVVKLGSDIQPISDVSDDLQLAHKLIFEGQPELAVEKIREQLSQAPPDMDRLAWVSLLGYALADQGKAAVALEELFSECEVKSNARVDEVYLLVLLRNLLLNESLELAEELIEFGEGVYGASSRTEFWLRGQAVLHNKKGNRDIAVAALSRLIEDFPDSKYTTLRNELRGADSTLTMSRLSAALVDFEGVFFEKEEYLPTVKVAPVYPRRAVTRGIEGYCIVEYTVSVEGRVVNPVAVECSPTGVFEFSSIKAAEKFLYTPRVINGQPVAVPNVRNKFTYGLEH